MVSFVLELSYAICLALCAVHFYAVGGKSDTRHGHEYKCWGIVQW
jgi:hypothetical protein